MNHNPQIHPVQIQILVALLFNPHATYSELMTQTGLSSDHFNFHLQSLVKQGYVAKNHKSAYTLTTIGKEHANQLDTENNTVERQPKSAILLTIVRQSDRGLELLVQQRLKQPFYGFWGKPTGKIRWGETVIQTAQRELLEETGLTCANPSIISVYHKIDRDKDTNEILEDKIFFEALCLNPEGELLEDFEGGKNKFVTQAEIPHLGKLFEGLDKPIQDKVDHSLSFTERSHYYSEDEY